VSICRYMCQCVGICFDVQVYVSMCRYMCRCVGICVFPPNNYTGQQGFGNVIEN
jgi:hypothetical protein